ncbi:MAG: bacterial-like globin family protein [Sphingomonas bacterium]|jgi:hemoglobin|uniref:group I truncated hemoglobin n=1 Tax=Sphingomonas bacterium TaxID=1895847 RepID=UPI002630079B|nr:group 1 truncated hemoglobin [Sphingomonas bacterium]MDB5703351.1 bacterial-like globin family protein [Sphingomonas bacterium]
MLIIALAIALQTVPPGEEPVDPYAQSNANAGAKPFEGTAMLDAFHGRAGIDRIVEDLVGRITTDKRIAEIFEKQDKMRLRRLLKEQFCYILNGGCDYSGRTMKDAHKDLGLQTADVGALVEDLQAAMSTEGVPFFAQNRFLAKLAPMKRDSAER